MIERWVKVKGGNIFVRMTDEDVGRYTVVFDAGYGNDSKAWDGVWENVSDHAQVIVYDRAGMGKSDPAKSPRTSLHMVEELRSVLHKLNITRPLILVGHSFGGVNIRLFASMYPNEVAGLILVDSTPVDYRKRFLPVMSEEFKDRYAKQFTLEGNYDEFQESLDQCKSAEKKPLQIPVIVLCAGKKDHYSEEAQSLWNDMQQELSFLSIMGEYRVIEDSAHYIQRDQPDVVISAIKELI
ncbi:Alpha/beta hydrolase [Bacillus sp. 349Y]|nr:Alpha/beta hydrolase [Bacillus sp. 349Y]